MSYKPQECTMWGEQRGKGTKAPHAQRLGLRPVYLCSLVVINWIWKGRKNFVHEIFHLQVIFSGNPLSYEKSKFFLFFVFCFKKKEKSAYNFFFMTQLLNPQATVQTRCFWSVLTPPNQAQAASRRGWTSPPLLRHQKTDGGHYCWAPAAAGTGIPSELAAAITGEPARGPRGEGVGTEEIPDIILALLTGVLPPAMLVELIRAWSFTTV